MANTEPTTSSTITTITMIRTTTQPPAAIIALAAAMIALAATFTNLVAAITARFTACAAFTEVFAAVLFAFAVVFATFDAVLTLFRSLKHRSFRRWQLFQFGVRLWLFRAISPSVDVFRCFFCIPLADPICSDNDGSTEPFFFSLQSPDSKRRSLRYYGQVAPCFHRF